MELSEIKSTMLQYVEALERGEKRVAEVEDRAERFNERERDLEARASELEGKLAELEDRRATVKAEIVANKTAYLDSLYQMDQAEQSKLQERKAELDGELQRLDKDIEATRKKLDAVPALDAEELEAIRSELEALSVPAHWIFLRDLRPPLYRAELDLTSRVSRVDLSLPDAE